MVRTLGKAKEGTERIAYVEKERAKAKEESQVARVSTVTTGDAKARAEGDLARVQDAMAATEEAKEIAEEAKRNAEAEATRLEVEWTSLLLEIGLAKDMVSSLHSQVEKDKEAMEEDYQKALEVIFAYGYGCCVFKHNICGDQLQVSDGMLVSSDPLLPEFFVIPRLPPIPASIEAIVVEVHPGEAAKELEENVVVGDQS